MVQSANGLWDNLNNKNGGGSIKTLIGDDAEPVGEMSLNGYMLPLRNYPDKMLHNSVKGTLQNW